MSVDVDDREKNGRKGKLGSEGSRFRWEAVMFSFNLVI